MAGNEKFRSKDGVDEPSELSADEQRAVTEAVMASEKDLTIVNEKPASVHYGLAVDQLREVYPELVYEDSYGNVSVNYVEMIPLLVQALNEQSAKIDALRERLAEYTGEEVIASEAKDRTSVTAVNTAIADAAMVKTLGQNDPNPFSESTSISMTVPSRVKSAILYIYDMSGKQVTGISVSSRGKTAVNVTGQNLTPGMYLYSLVCDGEVVATRRMILTR